MLIVGVRDDPPRMDSTGRRGTPCNGLQMPMDDDAGTQKAPHVDDRLLNFEVCYIHDVSWGIDRAESNEVRRALGLEMM